ncbi:MAG: GspE/PulE/PilB domain-containing protein [Thermodesulfovibrionales bacterium]
MKKQKKKLGEILLEAGLIDELQLRSALSYQSEWGGRLGSVLIKKGFVTEKDMLGVIVRQYGINTISLESIQPPTNAVLKLVRVDIARKFGVFPLEFDGKTLLIAVADPTDLKVLDDLSFMIGVRIRPILALESEILRAIKVHYEGWSCSEREHAAANLRDAHLGKSGTNPPEGHAAGISKTAGFILTEHPEFSQRDLLEGLINLLTEKGIISKEDLLSRMAHRKTHPPHQ